MVDILEKASRKIKSWARKNIKESDLAEDGFETIPHVTVLYGFLKEVDTKELFDTVTKFGTINLSIGKISRFESDDCDVIKCEIISPDLHKLNSIITKKFKDVIENKHPSYNPHLTLAYVKKGTCKELDGKLVFKGNLSFNNAVYSNADEEKTIIHLKKTLKKIITELRKNPDLNPKLTNAQNLEKYKDQEDIFITFSNNELATFNLKSPYDTPFGVYCYPIKEVWKEIELDEIPFAGERGYIHVLKNVSKSFIDDIDNLPNGEGVALINKMIRFAINIFINEDTEAQMKMATSFGISWDAIVNELELFKIKGDREYLDDALVHDVKRFWLPKVQKSCFHKSSGGIFWWATKRMGDVLLEANTKKFGKKPIGFIWRELMLAVGIQGVADRKGKGIIHPNEPLQAVFFEPKAFKHIDTVINDVRSVDVHKANGSSKVLLPHIVNPVKHPYGVVSLRPSGDKADRFMKHGKLDVQYDRLTEEQKKKYRQLMIKNAGVVSIHRQDSYAIENDFSDEEIADYIVESLNNKVKHIAVIVRARINPKVIELIGPEFLNRFLDIHIGNKITKESYEALNTEEKKQYDSNINWDIDPSSPAFKDLEQFKFLKPNTRYTA